MSTQLIHSGGLMQTLDLAQVVYLDFDGESTAYNGEILTVDNVEVQNSNLTQERIQQITAALNEQFATQNVQFVLERPASGEYSTIYIGKTSSFEPYGTFAGLAETVDSGNQNKNDNAFVMLDSTADNVQIISTIAHETNHLLGTLDHGGDGLLRYADGKRYDVTSGMTFTGITLGDYYHNTSDCMHVHSSGTAVNTYVYCGYHFCTGEEPKRDEESGLHVSNGGMAKNTCVFLEGGMYVCSGGIATDTILRLGSLGVYSGGTAIKTTNWDGTLWVGKGGKALDTIIEQYGSVYISGTATNTTINSDGKLCVSSGGTATNTTVNYGGSLYVSEGGFASVEFNPWMGTIINDGGEVAYLERNANVYWLDQQKQTQKGNDIRNLTIFTGQSAIIYEGGNTSNCQLQTGGSMTVYKGGSVNGLTATRDFTIADHIELADVIVMKRAELSDYAAVTRARITSGGSFFLRNGASAAQTEITSGALFVLGAGIAEDITVQNGGVFVATGGEVKGNITVGAAGGLYLYGGSIVNGEILIKGTVSADEAMVNNAQLTVALPAAASANAVIRNLDCMIGTGSFTVDVQEAGLGSYTLADGAAIYSGNIRVSSGSTELGTLAVGETKEFANASYTLAKSDGELSLTIADKVIVSAKSDLDGNGISDVMFQYTGGDYQIGFWMNGKSTWQATGAAQPDNWELLGNYDMDANGKADQVMFGNVLGGAYIGYYKDGDTTSNGWQNIGYLSNSDGIEWHNVIGNLTGNAGKNSIVWQAPELNACGVWTDGTTNWVGISGSFDTNWEMLGCGDFTGDGKDEILWQYNGALYTTDINSNFASLGGWGTAWEVRAIGDFSGDGKDDIVVFHKDTGSVVKFANGLAENWSSLGQLDASDWFIVGAGDYNNDKKDDLLVRQYSTGMLGYYSAGDMSQWNEMGRGVDMNWTVIA